MKNLRLIKILATLLLSVFIFSECRKGEEDPFISLRSRNNRLTGKWKLVEEKYEYEYKSNFVMDFLELQSDFKREYCLTEKRNYDGEFITKERKVSDDEYKVYQYIADTITKNDTVILDYEKGKRIETSEYSIELEINESNTWAASYHETSTIDYKLETNDSYYNIHLGKSIIEEDNIDTTYNYITKDRTESGEWFWEDDEKDKIFINAGPMRGYLKKLSNKEIIIEKNISGSNSMAYPNIDMSRVYFIDHTSYPHYKFYVFTAVEDTSSTTLFYQRWEKIK